MISRFKSGGLKRGILLFNDFNSVRKRGKWLFFFFNFLTVLLLGAIRFVLSHYFYRRNRSFSGWDAVSWGLVQRKNFESSMKQTSKCIFFALQNLYYCRYDYWPNRIFTENIGYQLHHPRKSNMLSIQTARSCLVISLIHSCPTIPSLIHETPAPADAFQIQLFIYCITNKISW